MPTARDVSLAEEQTTLGPRAAAAGIALLLLGLAGLAAAAGFAWAGEHQLRRLLHGYLLSFCYFLSLSLGALCFVALQHVSRAGWSVTVRRVAEVLAANIPMLAVLFVPVLMSAWAQHAGLYPWADAAAAQDSALVHRQPYLNPVFFTGRAALYFLVWWWLGRFFLRRSLEQDRTGEVALTLRMERFSPIALLLYGLTVTFAAFDWLMSLTPRWQSTIFGLYFFSGGVVAALAGLILILLLLQAAGRLKSAVTTEHYHDLGKLLFAFVIFWGYIAFSQYLLIWYANIPEETAWYQPRHSGPWGAVSLVLVFGHLVLPLFGLLPRWTKRSKPVLGFWAAWLLAMHWIDLYWVVMPGYDPQRLPFGPIEVCCLVGVGGMYLAGLVFLCRNRSLVPLADPRLEESLSFENVC